MTQQPDPERLGGFAWTQRTGGNLTSAERRRLLGAIAKGQLDYILGRFKLLVGHLPEKAKAIDVREFQPPDSKLAREAETACAEQSAGIIGHSYRTWLFGLALAKLDDRELDQELFYTSALLHDYGISTSPPGRDFTLGSAERILQCAQATATPKDQAETMADAVCVHTTAGIEIERDGALGYYIQWGAMADGIGLRIWDIAPHNVEAAVELHPREQFKQELPGLLRAEAASVPKGRMALLARLGAPFLVRIAPFSE